MPGVKDPKNQALRTHKKVWNGKYKNFSARLKQLKDGINGRAAPKMGIPASNLKDPLPDQVGAALDNLANEFQELVSGANQIIDEQADFSKTRRKKGPQAAPGQPTLPPQPSKAPDQVVQELSSIASIDKEASKLSRMWEYLKSSLSRDEARKERVGLLRRVADLYYNFLDLENTVLPVSIDNIPDVLSEYQRIYNAVNDNLDFMNDSNKLEREKEITAKVQETKNNIADLKKTLPAAVQAKFAALIAQLEHLLTALDQAEDPFKKGKIFDLLIKKDILLFNSLQALFKLYGIDVQSWDNVKEGAVQLDAKIKEQVANQQQEEEDKKLKQEQREQERQKDKEDRKLKQEEREEERQEDREERKRKQQQKEEERRLAKEEKEREREKQQEEEEERARQAKEQQEMLEHDQIELVANINDSIHKFKEIMHQSPSTKAYRMVESVIQLISAWSHEQDLDRKTQVARRLAQSFEALFIHLQLELQQKYSIEVHTWDEMLETVKKLSVEKAEKVKKREEPTFIPVTPKKPKEKPSSSDLPFINPDEAKLPKESSLHIDLVKAAHNPLSRYLKKQLLKLRGFNNTAVFRLRIVKDIEEAKKILKALMTSLEKELNPDVVVLQFKELDKVLTRIRVPLRGLHSIYKASFYAKTKKRNKMDNRDDKYMDYVLQRQIRRDLGRGMV